jgi:hypothetical protein
VLVLSGVFWPARAAVAERADTTVVRTDTTVVRTDTTTIGVDSMAAPLWNRDLISRIAGSQASFSNWAEGGINTLALTLGLEGKVTRTIGKWAQTHEMRFKFGLVKQDTLNIRKAEDLIRLTSSFRFQGEGFFRNFNPTIAASARSQFAPGYNFDKDPLGLGLPPPVKVSDLFSPATFNQTFGLTFDPAPWFKQRFGVGAKQTVVMIERIRPLYKVDPNKASRFELGLEAHTEVDAELAKNIRYKSEVGLFAAFNKTDLPDLLWENLIAMKVNTWLGMNFDVAVLFDRDVSSAVQFKEVFSVGVSLSVI